MRHKPEHRLRSRIERPRAATARKRASKPSTSAIAKKIEEEFGDLGYDAQDELRKKGIYYITGDIESDSLLEIHQDILNKHVTTRWKKDVQLVINSLGGECAEGWMMIDLLDYVRMDVVTIGMGENCSLAAMLLAAGTPGKRFAARNMSLMIHGFSTSLWGTKRDLDDYRRFVDQEHKREVDFWLRCSKLKTAEEVEKKFLDGRDHWISAEEALELGVIDELVSSKNGLK